GAGNSKLATTPVGTGPVLSSDTERFSDTGLLIAYVCCGLITLSATARSARTAAVTVMATPDELLTGFGSGRSEKIVAITDTGCEVALLPSTCTSHGAAAPAANVPSNHRCCPFTSVRLHVAAVSCSCGGTSMAKTVFGASRLLAFKASTCTVVDSPWLIVDRLMLAV